VKWALRRYRDEEDYWRIRDFLRQVFQLNGRRELSWQVARLDYWRWHVNENIVRFRLEDVVFLWENEDGRIAAVLNPEGKGEVFLQVHPGLRTPELEEEMLVTAEKNLATSRSNGQHRVRVWATEHDDLRRDILLRRGYAKGEGSDYQRRRSLDAPILEAPPAPGYAVRSLGGAEELPARSWASWKAFHPDDPDERYEGWEWYHNIQRIPLYRRDLDIVAIAPNDEVASFCTVWYDDVTRTGYFEPVGTAPSHQRRGLGKAVIREGLRRLKRLGATVAYVHAETKGGNALYPLVGFTEYDLSEPWAKEL